MDNTAAIPAPHLSLCLFFRFAPQMTFKTELDRLGEKNSAIIHRIATKNHTHLFLHALRPLAWPTFTYCSSDLPFSSYSSRSWGNCFVKGRDWIVTMSWRAMMEWILMIVFPAYSQSPLFLRTMVASTQFCFQRNYKNKTLFCPFKEIWKKSTPCAKGAERLVIDRNQNMLSFPKLPSWPFISPLSFRWWSPQSVVASPLEGLLHDKKAFVYIIVWYGKQATLLVR